MSQRLIVLGATGALGRELLSVLAERKFDAGDIFAYSSEKTAGEAVEYGDDELVVENLNSYKANKGDIVFSLVPPLFAKDLIPTIISSGAIVIDCSNAFSMLGEIPVVVPELNKDKLRIGVGRDAGFLVTNPRSSSVLLSLVLEPLHQAFEVSRVVISSYLAAASWGRSGMDELWKQTCALLQQDDVPSEKFPAQLAFNCIGRVGQLGDDGWTDFEKQVAYEIRAILDSKQLPISFSAVQIPVFSADSYSLIVEFSSVTSAEQVVKVLESSPGVVLYDLLEPNALLTPLESAYVDAACVSRVRDDASAENCVALWVVGDVLRRGAAINAAQIAEMLCSSSQ